MGNRKKIKDPKVHAELAGGDRQALCSKKRVKSVTTDPAAVTCLACGQVAQGLLDRALAQEEAAELAAHERQRKGLAALQQPRWWEDQKEGRDG